MTTADSILHTTTRQVSFHHEPALVELLGQLDPTGVWVREGQGLIGLGTAATASATGPGRFAELAHWWNSLPLVHDDAAASSAPQHGPALSQHRSAVPQQGPAPGPVGFTTITYSAESEHASVMILPELLISSTEQGVWLTAVSPPTLTLDEQLSAHGLRLDDSVLSLIHPAEPPPVPHTEQRPGRQSQQHYLSAVEAGLSAIGQGVVEKLVLARDVVVTADEPLPVGRLLARLASHYADCWTYRVADVLGATPEMLVSVRGEEVFSRVLAGTVAHDAQDRWAHAGLLGDLKQNHEHQLAVYSLVEQLNPVVESLQPQAEPRVLELPNVYHLATDITGRLQRSANGELPHPLTVAEHAHPTAAVCGTPTPQADQLLAELEGLDRGAFAGPVGWVDTRGNADFGIALRGGVLEDESRVRLYAGCGVVEGSQPESELAETHAKLRVMLSTLGA